MPEYKHLSLEIENCPEQDFMRGEDVSELIGAHRHIVQAAFKHLLNTNIDLPAYSVFMKPYRWLRGDTRSMQYLSSKYGLNLDIENPLNQKWVLNYDDQEKILNCFSGQLCENQSLVFFYSKENCYIESERSGKILLGVGKIDTIGALSEYGRQGDQGQRCYCYERPITHTIRPNGDNFEGGVLMPYDCLQRLQDENGDLNLEECLAFVPAAHSAAFSNRSEHVSHDVAIISLRAILKALRQFQEVGVDTKHQQDWINKALLKIWEVRGPYPGLGEVLFKLEVDNPVERAHEIQNQAGEENDPWPSAEAFLGDYDGICWVHFPENRKNYIKLLSRFTYEEGQLDAYWDFEEREIHFRDDADDAAVLENPYLLFEMGRRRKDGLSFSIVDFGLVPFDHNFHYLQPNDRKRIRAMAIQALEVAALQLGHTILPEDELLRGMREIDRLPIDAFDHAEALEQANEFLIPEIEGSVNPKWYQLKRYTEFRNTVEQLVDDPLPNHNYNANYLELVNMALGPIPDAADALEKLARTEKAAALGQLMESRFSVLCGPAGAGKTTLLKILCQQVCNEGQIVLLAPTGKARVVLEGIVNGIANTSCKTVASFVGINSRFFYDMGVYRRNEVVNKKTPSTVIIDEASMLTEDMLDAVLDTLALDRLNRLILVGDPSQLPPIGAGRPFLDLVDRFKIQAGGLENQFPHAGNGYAELTIQRRQGDAQGNDLRFARLFSRAAPVPGDDQALQLINGNDDRISFHTWNDEESLWNQLLGIMNAAMGGANANQGDMDQGTFHTYMGAVQNNDYYNYNLRGNDNQNPPVDCIDKWQILSPLNLQYFGCKNLNKKIRDKFFNGHNDTLGKERLVRGNKVINLSNHERRTGRRGYPNPDNVVSDYLANGEIGVAVNLIKKEFLNIEFSTQRSRQFGYKKSEIDEKWPLSLAYALTVHKVQGSQFEWVIVILPKRHMILSRELLYTALTRHKNRVFILHHKEAPLRELATAGSSVAAERFSNLFRLTQTAAHIFHDGSRRHLQIGLMPRAEDGRVMRSESEVLIANCLIECELDYNYRSDIIVNGQLITITFCVNRPGGPLLWIHSSVPDQTNYLDNWDEIAQELEAAGHLVISTHVGDGFGEAYVNNLIQNHLIH